MPWLYAKKVFTRFGAEKGIFESDVAFAAGKNKSKPKTFQTPENTILSLSKTNSFNKIFTTSWIVKLVVNSLQHYPNGNGLLFHMTQPISRSTIKAIACSKPTISEH